MIYFFRRKINKSGMLCDRCYALTNDNVTVEYPSFLAGFGSDFDSVDNKFLGDYENEEQFRELYPWTVICDNCIIQLIKEKKLELDQSFQIYYPLYVDCCDDYIEDDHIGVYIIQKDGFPYFNLNIRKDNIENWGNIWYLKRKYSDSFEFKGTFCEKCFSKNKDKFDDLLNNSRIFNTISIMVLDLPYFCDNFSPNHCDMNYLIEEKERINFAMKITPIYDEYFKFQNSRLVIIDIILEAKNNMNKIKEELKCYIGLRNLKFINYPFPKDIVNYILTFL